jgi:hypothetical protein
MYDGTISELKKCLHVLLRNARMILSATWFKDKLEDPCKDMHLARASSILNI